MLHVVIGLPLVSLTTCPSRLNTVILFVRDHSLNVCALSQFITSEHIFDVMLITNMADGSHYHHLSSLFSPCFLLSFLGGMCFQSWLIFILNVMTYRHSLCI